MIREYLGDGLYADYDGEQFRLHTQRNEGEHEVFLEPHVLAAFLAFVERERKRRAGQLNDW